MCGARDRDSKDSWGKKDNIRNDKQWVVCITNASRVRGGPESGLWKENVFIISIHVH